MLYVADLTNILSESQCIQYDDDVTNYRSCKVKDLEKYSTKVENN